ncbi:hypothetical protein IFM89_016969 [Coptis chinensis]|uniref:Uncharacterized protein n=1 Tax=Coptis chinensis TaxID=261450 RepID=A0A835LUH0_9MAGN|nr:hypothetical protein IFM89_016969 [Coptis chinensis]
MVASQNNEEEINKTAQQQRLCDFCGETKALLYCKADSAKLCFKCDKQVHSTNQLFCKHTRSQLCDVCNSNPASIFCSTDNLVLCQNCDWESHGNSNNKSHDRRPLEGFTGCPSVNELCTIFGFEDLGKKKSFLIDVGSDGLFMDSGVPFVDGFDDFLVWETPPIFSIDDLIGSTDSTQSFQAMGNPPLPKNRNTACGKHKEDIMSQLGDMMELENCFINDPEDVEFGFQPLVPESNLQQGKLGTGFEHFADAEPIPFPVCKESENKWIRSSEESVQVPFPYAYTGSYTDQDSSTFDKSDVLIGDDGSEAKGDLDVQVPQYPAIGETPVVLPKVALHKTIGHNRDSLLSRYKEKKKTRRYDHHIRYESRKARAEGRSRVRGRFAKYVVAARGSCSKVIEVCRPHDAEWCSFGIDKEKDKHIYFKDWIVRDPDEEEDEVHFQDLLFHKGRLYGLTKQNKLFCFELSESEPFCPKVLDILPMERNERPAKFATKLFLVYKLQDLNGILQWVQVESLGDQMLFWGRNSGMSISANSVSGFEGNSIYFNEDFWSYFWFGYGPNLDSCTDNGVFYLDDGGIESFFTSDDFLPLKYQPIWVTPNKSNC